jgi:hypothetical protein
MCSTKLGITTCSLPQSLFNNKTGLREEIGRVLGVEEGQHVWLSSKDNLSLWMVDNDKTL